jgi:predicted RNase H-like HicB family nuclease
MAVRERVYTAVYQQDDGWWVAWVEGLPGANSQGETLEEARENLRDAVEMMVEATCQPCEVVVSSEAIIREQLIVTG